MRRGEFSNANHLLVLREERCNGQKNRGDANDAKLNGLVGDIIGTNRRLILHTKNTGAWMKVQVTMLTGTVFSDMEFCDGL